MTVTSYFANHRKLKLSGYVLVSVARVPVEGLLELKEFAPSKDLLLLKKQDKITEQDFTVQYLKELEDIPKERVIEIITRLNSGNFALCCYCGKDKFCHRHILSNWLNERYKTEIKEF